MSGAGTRELVVPEQAAGQRLDVFVKESLALSRAAVKALIDDRKVRVDGRPAKKGQTVAPGQKLTVEVPSQEKAAAPDASIALEILHLDDALVFVNKPARVPSHPLRPGEVGTVANALVARWPELGAVSDDPREGGLGHRLDVETSGVMVAARTRQAWTALRAAFSERGAVDKRYWALVTGPLADEGEIDLPLRHHPRHPDRVEPAVEGGPDARDAVSVFRVLGRAGEYSLVEVRIFTGVLHQVRAHLAAIGAPLVGDALYGGRPFEGLGRFFLHARSLSLKHPTTAAQLTVEAPLPEDLRQVLEKLRLSTSG